MPWTPHTTGQSCIELDSMSQQFDKKIQKSTKFHKRTFFKQGRFNKVKCQLVTFTKPWQVTILQVQFDKNIFHKNSFFTNQTFRDLNHEICKTRNIFLQLQGKICTFGFLIAKHLNKKCSNDFFWI